MVLFLMVGSFRWMECDNLLSREKLGNNELLHSDLKRQYHPKGRLAWRGFSHLDGAVVLLDDALADVEAHAGALTLAFGGKVGLEDVVQDVVGEARAGVFDFNVEALQVTLSPSTLLRINSVEGQSFQS